MKKKRNLKSLCYEKNKENSRKRLMKRKGNVPSLISPLKLETYAVAYLDFLGTTERMQGEKSDESLNIINAVYTLLLLFCSTFEHHNKNVGDFEIRIFSDNVVIAKKIKDINTSYLDDLADLLFATSIFQELALSLFQWPLRGGITIGDFYINSNFVWGQALIDAHNLEENTAKYPRVVIDPKIIQHLTTIGGITALNSKVMDGMPSASILCDADGRYYLSYLEPKFMILKQYHYVLDKQSELRNKDETGIAHLLKLIVKQLSEGRENLIILAKSSESAPPNVQEKISWSIHYHNMMCDKFNHPEYKVS